MTRGFATHTRNQAPATRPVLFYCPETGKVKVTARLTPGNNGTKACTHTQVGAILPDAHLPHQIEAR